MRYVSHIYGLTVGTDFPLLSSSAPFIHGEELEVTVELKSLAQLDCPLTSDCILGTLSGVGQVLIRNGREIVIDVAPEHQGDEGLLRPSVLGPLMSALLQQRGFLVLHASAVLFQEQAIAFIGQSGAGKSTTASAFVKYGCPLVTDDVLAIRFHDAQPWVTPSYPVIKLLPDAVDALGHQPFQLPLLNKTSSKRLQTVADFPGATAYPLAKVYILAVGDRHEIMALSSTQALFSLISNSRTLNTLLDASAQKTHFQQCAKMVQSIPINRLNRKPSLDELTDIIKLVEQDLTQEMA